MEPDLKSNSTQTRLWVLGRLIATFILLFLVGISFYVFNDKLTILTISYSLLFLLPFSLGAVATFLLEKNAKGTDKRNSSVPIYLVIGILVIGGITLKEGVICMIILSPIWLGSAYVGTLAVRWLHRFAAKRTSLYCTSLIILPFSILLIEGEGFSKPTEYIVTRSVTIEVPADVIWPHLLSMENIRANEGQWNFTQNLLSIPRPTSAVVSGNGIGAWRNAKWGDNISFEEHITEWQEGRSLRWHFIFPNDSVQRYTDKHISPDGEHLKIVDGGYYLETLGSTRTRLTLDTVYIATTPINQYSALWGEVILGDIQNNILEIVKNRTEQP